MFNDVFQDRTVLVTGHTGFKGSWLVTWLNELGANVIGYALDPYHNYDNYSITNLSKRIVDVRDDIRNFDVLDQVFEKYHPEFVFHLAAQPLVSESYSKPIYTYQTNVMGTVNILELLRRYRDTKVAIIVTSDKCYENKEWVWGYRENDRLGGYDPYSSSKACAELIVSAFQKSFFSSFYDENRCVGVASVRAGNVIGGGDWQKDRIVPDCIKALKIGKKITIRSPNSVRPWQHVLEPLYGYLELASKLYENPKEFRGAWNFGPQDSALITVIDLVKKIIDEWGEGDWIDKSNKLEFHETRLLKLDISKSINFLNWKPILNVNDAIEWTVKWYKQAKPSYDYNVKQIRKFEEYLK